MNLNKELRQINQKQTAPYIEIFQVYNKVLQQYQEYKYKYQECDSELREIKNNLNDNNLYDKLKQQILLQNSQLTDQQDENDIINLQICKQKQEAFEIYQKHDTLKEKNSDLQIVKDKQQQQLKEQTETIQKINEISIKRQHELEIQEKTISKLVEENQILKNIVQKSTQQEAIQNNKYLQQEQELKKREQQLQEKEDNFEERLQSFSQQKQKYSQERKLQQTQPNSEDDKIIMSKIIKKKKTDILQQTQCIPCYSSSPITCIQSRNEQQFLTSGRNNPLRLHTSNDQYLGRIISEQIQGLFSYQKDTILGINGQEVILMKKDKHYALGNHMNTISGICLLSEEEGVSGDRTGLVIIWDLARQQIGGRIESGSGITSLISMNSQNIVSTHEDCSLRIYSVQQKKEVFRCKNTLENEKSLTSAVLSHNGHFIGCLAGKVIKIIDMRKQKVIALFTHPLYTGQGQIVFAEGDTSIMASCKQIVFRWQLGSNENAYGQIVYENVDHVLDKGMCWMEGRLVLAGERGQLYILDNQ